MHLFFLETMIVVVTKLSSEGERQKESKVEVISLLVGEVVGQEQRLRDPSFYEQ